MNFEFTYAESVLADDVAGPNAIVLFINQDGWSSSTNALCVTFKMNALTSCHLKNTSPWYEQFRHNYEI